MHVPARTGLRPALPRLRLGYSPAGGLHRDFSRDSMLLLGVCFGIAQARGMLAGPIDAINYWLAGTSTELYPQAWGQWWGGQYLYYPPPTAQLSILIQPLGWSLFIVCWTTLIFACFWYCARDLSLPLLALGIPAAVFGIPELGLFAGYALNGNMQWVLAALVLLALRRPALWAVMAVTKITPAIGVLWYVVRREWRPAAVATGTTLLVVTISFVLAPAVWIDWAGFTLRNYAMADPPMPLFPVPFGIRLVTAAVLVVWGARTDRIWTVPVAAGWALPALYGFGFLPFWVAALRLVPAPHLHLSDLIGRGASTMTAPADAVRPI